MMGRSQRSGGVGTLPLIGTSQRMRALAVLALLSRAYASDAACGSVSFTERIITTLRQLPRRDAAKHVPGGSVHGGAGCPGLRGLRHRHVPSLSGADVVPALGLRVPRALGRSDGGDGLYRGEIQRLGRVGMLGVRGRLLHGRDRAIRVPARRRWPVCRRVRRLVANSVSDGHVQWLGRVGVLGLRTWDVHRFRRSVELRARLGGLVRKEIWRERGDGVSRRKVLEQWSRVLR